MNDPDWLQELFTRARLDEEPLWIPDAAAIKIGGRRRRRLRAVSVGGGALGALAVTTAVVVGLGGVTLGGEGGLMTVMPHSSSVFHYASIHVAGSQKAPSTVLPVSVVDKASELIDVLDPGHAYLRSMVSDASVPQYRTVEDSASAVKGLTAMTATSVYATDGTVPPRDSDKPNGSLAATVALNAQQLGRYTHDTPDVSTDTVPCGYMLQYVFQNTPPTPRAHWSKCTSIPLSDGSKLDSASTPNGQGTVTVAIREYPDNAGGMVVVWTDYANGSTTLTDPARMNQAPDPSLVLKPNPITETKLSAVLADPQFGLVGQTSADGTSPEQFLRPGDLSTHASYDPRSFSEGSGDLPMDNGCAYKDVPLVRRGPVAAYAVATPGGKPVTVTELEYPLPLGTGASTMATARSQAAGGCDSNGLLYSRDTVEDLPTGIGDEAFVEYGVGTNAVTVWERFGDTILRVDVTQDQGMPDLSAPADRAWLENLAKRTASRWTAKN